MKPWNSRKKLLGPLQNFTKLNFMVHLTSLKVHQTNELLNTSLNSLFTDFLQTNSSPKRKSTKISETTSTPPSWNLSSRNKRQISIYLDLRDVNKSLDVAGKILLFLFDYFAFYSPLNPPKSLTNFNHIRKLSISLKNWIYFLHNCLL